MTSTLTYAETLRLAHQRGLCAERTATLVCSRWRNHTGDHVDLRSMTAFRSREGLPTMTATERLSIARLVEAAEHRASRAARLGDRAGSLIAAGDARRLRARLDADRHGAARPPLYAAEPQP